MTVWYKNYFGDTSQPWARQVQKEIDNQKALFQSAEVNNLKRDDQLASSLRQVQSASASASQAAIDAASAAQAAADANAAAISALQGLGSLDESTSTYKINADNLTAGTINAININGSTITGSTLTTASAGSQRVILNSNNITVNNGAANTGSIYGSTYGGTNSIQMVSTNGHVAIANGSSAIFGGTAPNAFTVLAGDTQVNDGDFAVGDGKATFNNNVYNPGGYSNTTTATANMYISSGGLLMRSTSGRKYKSDIQDLQLNPNALELRPRTWIDAGEFNENNGSTDGLKRVPGFIAEEVHDLGLTEFVIYDDENNPDGVAYDRLLAAVIPIIKNQDAKIKDLEARLSALEGQ